MCVTVGRTVILLAGNWMICRWIWRGTSFVCRKSLNTIALLHLFVMVQMQSRGVMFEHWKLNIYASVTHKLEMLIACIIFDLGFESMRGRNIVMFWIVFIRFYEIRKCTFLINSLLSIHLHKACSTMDHWSKFLLVLVSTKIGGRLRTNTLQ